MDIFSRNVKGMTEILRRCVVGVAGCGGLGTNAAIALARAGVGKLILADFDKVEPSNLNRQQFLRKDIGVGKVKALARHIKGIGAGIRLEERCLRLTPRNLAGVFAEADILLEAFDRADSKAWLINAWGRAFPDKDVICGNGLADYGRMAALKVSRAGDHVWFCGDGSSDMAAGLCSARVAIVANMQANLAIELLMKKGRRGPR